MCLRLASPVRLLVQVDVLVEMKDSTTVIPRNSLIEANQSGLIAEPLIDITPQTPVPQYKGGFARGTCASQLPHDSSCRSHPRMHAANPLDEDCEQEGLVVCHQGRIRGERGAPCQPHASQAWTWHALSKGRPAGTAAAGVALDDLVYLCTKIARQMDTQGVERVFETMEAARAAIEDAKPLLAQAVKLSDEVGKEGGGVWWVRMCGGCPVDSQVGAGRPCSSSRQAQDVGPRASLWPASDSATADRVAGGRPRGQRRSADAGLARRFSAKFLGGCVCVHMCVCVCVCAACVWDGGQQRAERRRQGEWAGCPCAGAPVACACLQVAAEAAADIQRLQTEVLTETNVKALRESVQTLTKTLHHVEQITGDLGGLTGDKKFSASLKALVEALSRIVVD